MDIRTGPINLYRIKDDSGQSSGTDSDVWENKVDDKEMLIRLKYANASELSQRKLKEKREQLVARLTAPGMHQSSIFVRETTKFELKA